MKQVTGPFLCESCGQIEARVNISNLLPKSPHFMSTCRNCGEKKHHRINRDSGETGRGVHMIGGVFTPGVIVRVIDSRYPQFQKHLLTPNPGGIPILNGGEARNLPLPPDTCVMIELEMPLIAQLVTGETLNLWPMVEELKGHSVGGRGVARSNMSRMVNIANELLQVESFGLGEAYVRRVSENVRNILRGSRSSTFDSLLITAYCYPNMKRSISALEPFLKYPSVVSSILGFITKAFEEDESAYLPLRGDIQRLVLDAAARNILNIDQYSVYRYAELGGEVSALGRYVQHGKSFVDLFPYLNNGIYTQDQIGQLSTVAAKRLNVLTPSESLILTRRIRDLNPGNHIIFAILWQSIVSLPSIEPGLVNEALSWAQALPPKGRKAVLPMLRDSKELILGYASYLYGTTQVFLSSIGLL